MKQKMKLGDVMDYYKTTDVESSPDGYELTDEASGIVFVLPRRFQIFIDGSLLDPMKFLTLPADLYGLVFAGRIQPLEARYICGEYNFISENGKHKLMFYPSETYGELEEKAALLRLTWDMREAVTDSDWKEAFDYLYGKGVAWSDRKADLYETAGTWYVLLDPNLDVFGFGSMSVRALVVNYMRTLQPVYRLSDEALEKFDKEKSKYKAMIWDIVAPYKKKPNWKVMIDDNCTVLKHDDTVGKITVYSYRHDGIGYADCASEFGKKEES